MESSAHPERALASARPAARRWYPGPGTCCTCRRTSTCASDATRTPRRPTRRRSPPIVRYLAAGRCPARLPRRLRRPQPPFPVRLRRHGGQEPRRARGGAGRLSRRVRTDARRSQHGHPAAIHGAAAVRAGALRAMAGNPRGHAAARRRRALSARDLALRARYGLCDEPADCRGARGARSDSTPSPLDPALRANQDQEHQCGHRARADRAADAAGGHCGWPRAGLPMP